MDWSGCRLLFAATGWGRLIVARESIRIEGLEGVLATLRQLPAEVVSKNGGPVRAALRKAALVIQRQAQANVDKIVADPNIGGRASKSSGALRDAITSKRVRMPAGVKGERFWVGIAPLKKKYADTKQNRRKQRVGKSYVVLPPAYYAWFLERGTERQGAKPFMRPAFEARKGEAVAIFTRELPVAIDRIVKRLAHSNRVKP